jgi:hypothetical protein
MSRRRCYAICVIGPSVSRSGGVSIALASRSCSARSPTLTVLPDETFICSACNAEIEERRPWLFEHRVSLGEDHHWSHTLVSLPAPAKPEPPPRSALEECLARVEAKLDEHSRERAGEHAAFAAFAGDMNARMERLEAVVARLAGAQPTAS